MPADVIRVCAWPGPSDRRSNPYTWLIHAPMSAHGVRLDEYDRWALRQPACDVFHAHWPENAFWGRIAHLGPAAKEVCARLSLARMRNVRRRGGILVWTAHNLAPHGSMSESTAQVWHRYFDAFRQQVDLVISMTHAARERLLESYPDLADRRHVVIPHPHYRAAYPPPVEKAAARRALGLRGDGRLICAIGYMRRYKGLTQLIRAFRAVARPEDGLLLGGDCPEDYLAALDRNREGDERVRIIPRRISDDEVAAIFSAADGCVVNHQTLLNSGGLMLALSFDCPVLARAHGSISELARSLGERWIATFDGDLDGPVLARFLNGQASGLQRRQIAPLDSLDPLVISASTVQEYRQSLARRHERPDRAG